MTPDASLPSDAPLNAAGPGDAVSVAKWFALYALLLAAAIVPLAMILREQNFAWEQWRQHLTWRDWQHSFGEAVRMTPPAAKLLILGIYLSLACTFLPLPTGWIVAALATQEAAVAGDVWSVTLLVALVGGFASTVANLNDYHLFTLVLRWGRVAKIRDTKLYQVSARWFEKRPFFLQTIFSFLPIPVDVIRLLAITYRYDRAKFAAANFIGRFIRYGVFAFVTYYYNLGWIAPVFLLALAVALAGIKGLHSVWIRIGRQGA